MRHKWNAHNACERCGLYRSGHSGGRTGSLTYLTYDGCMVRRAGPCVVEPEDLSPEQSRKEVARLRAQIAAERALLDELVDATRNGSAPTQRMWRALDAISKARGT